MDGSNIHLKSLFQRSLGVGSNVLIWLDHLCRTKPFATRFPRLSSLDTNINCLIASGIRRTNSVVSFHGTWRRLIRDGQESLELTEIENFHRNLSLDEGDNGWSLGLNSDGSFTSASLRMVLGYMGLSWCSPPTIWTNLEPLKVRIFIWRARLDRLPTKDNLAKRGYLAPQQRSMRLVQ